MSKSKRQEKLNELQSKSCEARIENNVTQIELKKINLK